MSLRWHKDVLGALNDRLDQIAQEQKQEQKDFEENPQNYDGPLQDSEERKEEVANIHVKMEEQHVVIARLEAEEEEKEKGDGK